MPNYPTSSNKRKRSAEGDKAERQQRCISLCQEAAYANSCKALVKPAPVECTGAVVRQLTCKHPSCAPVDLSHLGPASPALVPTLDPEMVAKAIRTFHPHSSGGPSGLRPGHIKDAIRTRLKDELLEHTAGVVQQLARGEAPSALAPFLAGASLTALPKKDHDLRPMASGEVWRRLVAKCLCGVYQSEARRLLWPLQIGVAQPLGTEVGIQTARQWFERHSGDPRAVSSKSISPMLSTQLIARRFSSNVPSLSC